MVPPMDSPGRICSSAIGRDSFLGLLPISSGHSSPPGFLWLIGQGKFAITLSQVGHGQYYVFDIFRLKDGPIDKQWDVHEKILAP